FDYSAGLVWSAERRRYFALQHVAGVVCDRLSGDFAMQPHHACSDLDAGTLAALCRRARAPRRIRHRTNGRAETSGNARAARSDVSFRARTGYQEIAKVCPPPGPLPTGAVLGLNQGQGIAN